MRTIRSIFTAAVALSCAGCVVPRQRYDEAEGERRLLEARCADLVRDREKLAAEKASAEAENARGARAAAKLEQRVKELLESNMDLTREAGASREKLAELEKKAAELDASRSQAVDEKKSLERKCERIENERATAQRRYLDLQEEHNRLQRRVAELEHGRADPAPPPPPAPAGGRADGQAVDVSGAGG